MVKGFTAHLAMLVIALMRAIADRVMLMDITLGRKGLLGYLKALVLKRLTLPIGLGTYCILCVLTHRYMYRNL